MSETAPEQRDVHIHASRDVERQFVLHPADNDVFVRTGKQIIEGCRLSISIGVWLEELRGMFGFLAEWCGERGEKIQSCLAVGRGSKVTVFFVPPGRQFSFELADELAELNRALIAGFNIGMVEVGQIPSGEIERFVDVETAQLIYGKPIEAPGPVEA